MQALMPRDGMQDAQGSLRSTRTGPLSSAILAARLRHITPGAAAAPPTLSGVLP